MENLKTAWIESFTWADKKDDNGNNKIEVSAKMWIGDGETKKLINKIIEELISSLGKIKGIDHIENIQMSLANGDILPFSFDIILGQQSEILVR
jgi:hypothetical protein